MKPKKYTVTWGYDFKQPNLSKAEALKIARELLEDNDSVTITEQK